MRVFLDFEASSLAKHGVPIEVAWVFEDGRCASHLIRPAPDWTDWDAKAEAIHHISRDMLGREGEAHDAVARAMVDQLSGHDLFASAPSWDGKWLSVLLRAAGLPRHTLRLRDTEEAQAEIAREVLRPVLPPERLDAAVEQLLTLVEVRARGMPAHRALADARQELACWQAVRAAAQAEAARLAARPAPAMPQPGMEAA